MTWEIVWTALRYGVLPTLAIVLVIAVLLDLSAWSIHRNRLEGQFPLILGFALMGSILGLATGNSRLATVSVLLSTLLSVVTLLLGYLFGETKLGPVRGLMPYCILAVLLSCLTSLLVGSVMRGRSEAAEAAAEHARQRERAIDWEIEKLDEIQERGLGPPPQAAVKP